MDHQDLLPDHNQGRLVSTPTLMSAKMAERQPLTNWNSFAKLDNPSLIPRPAYSSVCVDIIHGRGRVAPQLLYIIVALQLLCIIVNAIK